MLCGGYRNHAEGFKSGRFLVYFFAGTKQSSSSYQKIKKGYSKEQPVFFKLIFSAVYPPRKYQLNSLFTLHYPVVRQYHLLVVPKQLVCPFLPAPAQLPHLLIPC